MTLPEGVEHRSIGGETGLATRGETVYGEPTDGEWRPVRVPAPPLAVGRFAVHRVATRRKSSFAAD